MPDPQGARFAADYTLTRADALAWESRKRDLSGTEKLCLFSLIALGGLVYGATEQDLPIWFLLLPSLVQFALLAGTGFGIWRLGLHLAARLRAARRIPQPLPCRFEDRGDHFRLREGDRESLITRAHVLAVTTAPRHIFLATEDGPVILPTRAFPDPATAHAMAGLWAAQVRAAVDLDAKGD